MNDLWTRADSDDASLNSADVCECEAGAYESESNGEEPAE